MINSNGTQNWKSHNIMLHCENSSGYRPVARTFRRGVTRVSDVYVCMTHKHARLEGSEVMLPQENFRK